MDWQVYADYHSSTFSLKFFLLKFQMYLHKNSVNRHVYIFKGNKYKMNSDNVRAVKEEGWAVGYGW